MSKEYTITTETPDGIDVVTFFCPYSAVDWIQALRLRPDYTVTYTGDPFADVVALAAEEG